MKQDNPSAHYSVLLSESLAGLAIKPDGIYIDGTFGRGGHSRHILDELSSGQLLAIDQDVTAVAYAQAHFPQPNFHIKHGSFAEMAEFCEALGWLGKVNGVLLDLGVSSPQLDEAERGFSFMRAGPLDMRMNQQSGQSALEWLQAVEQNELTRVLREYGEEKFAGRIAKAIKKAVEEGSLATTLDLAEVVKQASPKHDKFKHPATRTFQAIRIAVNGELDALRKVLQSAVSLLAPQGRLAVISFHSLEDRMVKHFIREQSQARDLFPESPVPIAMSEPVLKKIGKPIFPTAEECKLNARSRSAVLRLAEKI